MRHFLGLAIWPASTQAYESYHDPALDGQGYCSNCHPGFTGGRSGTLHALHTGGTDPVTGECDLCHTGSGRDNPLTMWSVGDGLGCTGCHGRDCGETTQADYRGFPTAGKPKASGYGLRKHHLISGVTVCLSCHSDVDQSLIEPESVSPPYYGRPDVSLGRQPVDPCANEDSANDADVLGLDNDGDLLYDSADPDCRPAACGNGVVEPGEQCDDGNVLPGDCCDANCQYEPPGSPCPDALFCNGEETCDGMGSCQAGPPVDCDDGVGCTDDSCDEVSDSCVNAPNDNNCPDDGLFCNGQEICDPVLDCVSTGNPCGPGEVCDEQTDNCVPATTTTSTSTTTTSTTSSTTTTLPPQEADVYLIRLRAPKKVAAKLGQAASKAVTAVGDGDTAAQQATVFLDAAPGGPGVTVTITPSSITRLVTPGDGATRYKFSAEIGCLEKGKWGIEWTATITAPENRDPYNDVLAAVTQVVCR